MRTVVAVVLCVLAIPACKKTVEGETASWEQRKSRVQELATLYPGFAVSLTAQLQQAQQVMDAAKATTDQQQSIQKMAEANGLLDSGLCHAVDRADSRLKQLQSRLRSADTAVRARKELLVARATLGSIDVTLRSAQTLLKEGAGSSTAAMVRMGRVKRELDSAESDLHKVMASVKEYNEDRRAAKKKKKR